MTTERYDAIVIGAGQAGGPLATALATAGRKTALIERSHVGGTCVNVGCTPTKTMVASARVAYLARRAADYGVNTGDISVDLEVVRQRKRDIVTSFREGSEGRITSTANLDLIMGEATFTGPNTIDVALTDGGQRQLEAESFFINAGDRPQIPDLPGFDQIPVLDSTSIMELDSVPEHLVVIGGGYIGLEFGQMFRRFGSQVTIVQRGAQLLGREDEDIAQAVLDILQEDGIEVLLKTDVRSAEPASGGVRLHLHGPDGEITVTGTHLLAAAGRTPNTDALNLTAAGVATDKRGYITVDDTLATNVSGIFALGDIKGGPAFTHISYDDFRIIRTNVIEGGHASIANRLVPYVVYIDPQLGRIGLSETEARQQVRDIRIATMPMSSVARALETDEPRGVMKAIVDANTDQILGAAILGIEGGEIMSMLQLAMMGNLPYTALRDGTFAHPALAESLNNLFSTLSE
jgi:pyruvate/2-oxoglutarate dehydrogenase complex dihydrolipoamide dehydrogenase (E3) component